MSQRPRHAPRTPRLGLAAAVVAAVLSLTGCVTVQLKAQVHSDGTLSGTTRVGFSKSAIAASGLSAAQVSQLFAQEDNCNFGGSTGSTKSFDDGTYVGTDCSFSGVTMAQFNTGDDGPKLARQGDEYHLSGSLNVLDEISDATGALGPLISGGANGGLPSSLGSLLPSELPTDLSSLLPPDLASLLPTDLPTGSLPALPSGLGSLDPATVLKTAKISFQFSFPGKVTSTAGKADGSTVTFTPDGSGVMNFETVAGATGSGGGGIGSSGWIGLAALILVLAAVLGVVFGRRRRARLVTAAAVYPPAEFGPTYPTAQYPSQYAPPAQPYQPPPYAPPTQPYQPPPFAPPTQPYPGAQAQPETGDYQGPPPMQNPWSAPPPGPNPPRDVEP